MKRKLLYSILLLASIFLISNSNGVTTFQNLDRTGSPVSTTACNNCHSGGNFNPSLEIKLKDLNGDLVTSYMPDSSYVIEFEFGGNAAARYGYQATALLISDNSKAGTLEAANSDSKMVSLNDRDYADHNGLVTSNTFILEWTAPSAGAGSVGFYSAGIAADGNGSTSGDSPVTADALVVQEFGIEEPEEPEEPIDPTSITHFDDERLSLFPNPVVNYLNINLDINSSFTLKIYNQNGKLIIFENVNDKNASIDFNSFPNGLYIIEAIDNENNRYTSKIIKN